MGEKQVGGHPELMKGPGFLELKLHIKEAWEMERKVKWHLFVNNKMAVDTANHGAFFLTKAVLRNYYVNGMVAGIVN